MTEQATTQKNARGTGGRPGQLVRITRQGSCREGDIGTVWCARPDGVDVQFRNPFTGELGRPAWYWNGEWEPVATPNNTQQLPLFAGMEAAS